MNNALQELKKSFLTSLWFMFLTFPIMVIKVNTVENIVNWRWSNMVMVGVISFIMSYFWRGMLSKKERGEKLIDLSRFTPAKLQNLDLRETFANKKVTRPVQIILLVAALIFPFAAGMYQTSIMTTALMYVILGLGLNIVIGLGGMLHLGLCCILCRRCVYLCNTSPGFWHWFLGGPSSGCNSGHGLRNAPWLSRSET